MINSNDGGSNISFNGGRSWSTQKNQPTAQFYRVNVDNRFPYWVYGGQQDNSTVAIKSSTFSSGISGRIGLLVLEDVRQPTSHLIKTTLSSCMQAATRV